MASRDTADKELAKKSIFFILKFLGVFLLLSWFFNLGPISDFFINFFVFVIRCFLFIIGKGTVTIVNNELVVNSISMIVVKECTGVAMYSLFVAFMVSYGISRKTLKYGVFGLFMLIGLNILRLFTILVSTFFGTKVFYLVHDFLWPSTFFVFTLIAVLFYIKKSSK
ncbi:MAG: exosortase/archaeosortase family protein [Candidatus Woesearchaeota archaeon]